MLHRERGLVGEGREHAALGLAEAWRVGAAGDHDHGPDERLTGPHGHGQGPPRLEVALDGAADPDRPLGGGVGEPLRQVVGHPAVARREPDAALLAGQHDGAPGQVEQRPHGAHDPEQGLVEATMGDEARGQLEQGARLPLPPLGLHAPPLRRSHEQAHHERDDQVDAEREIVLPVGDDECVVRGQEQEVEGEEPQPGGGEAGPEAARRRRGDHDEQEGEDHVGLRDVAAEGEEQGGHRDRARDGHRVAERGPRSHDGQPSACQVHDL